MRVFLPDINILIALHDPQHVGHNKAHSWFTSEGQRGWATCPLTENGFARIISHTIYPNSVSGVTDALQILGNMITTHSVSYQFLPDSVSLNDRSLFDPSLIAGPKQITDIYLLGLCQQYGGTLVTLDSGITTTAIVSPHAELLRIL